MDKDARNTPKGPSWSRPVRIVGLIAAIVIVGGGAFVGLRGSKPATLLTHYTWDTLVAEANTMVECAECHEGEKFHGCDTCHDDHGAVEFEDVPFYAVVVFTGDVPNPGFVLIDDILPYRDQPHTHIPLLTFLEGQGVTEFESVTMSSDDGGFITVEREQLTKEALLLPYEDGIRFADEGLHISTWLKGITGIIVVGADRPMTVEGTPTSIGRLLMGPTLSATVEQTEVKFKSDETGEVRTAKTASRVDGAAVDELLISHDYTTLLVGTAAGDTVELPAEDVRGAILALLRGKVTLVLPDRARTEWISDVVSLKSQG